MEICRLNNGEKELHREPEAQAEGPQGAREAGLCSGRAECREKSSLAAKSMGLERPDL